MRLFVACHGVVGFMVLSVWICLWVFDNVLVVALRFAPCWGAPSASVFSVCSLFLCCVVSFDI